MPSKYVSKQSMLIRIIKERISREPLEYRDYNEWVANLVIDLECNRNKIEDVLSEFILVGYLKKDKHKIVSLWAISKEAEALRLKEQAELETTPAIEEKKEEESISSSSSIVDSIVSSIDEVSKLLQAEPVEDYTKEDKDGDTRNG